MDEFDLDVLLAGVGDSGAAASECVEISQDDYAALIDASTIRPQAKRGEGASAVERKRASRRRQRERSHEDVAVLDFETDPFDNVNRSDVHPFLAVLYADHFDPVVIWDEDKDSFVKRVCDAIEALPRSYTIYAHNGGKFDYMFLLKRLIGKVMFKGRGIMTAQLGNHELRDSYHIIPDRLANFKKDHIDYENMRAGKRHAYKQEIIDYCISDCRYLLEIVKGFISRFGTKLSIGQAAMAKIRENYKFEHLSDAQDEFFRQWFFGGRVECLQGRVRRQGRYRLYDVNSMYPYVMAEYEHPIGSFYIERAGDIGPDTMFIDLSCNSRGAFILKEGEQTKAPHGYYRFKTTIWEYNVAVKHNLIDNVTIHKVIDIPLRTNFSKFVVPLYQERQKLKGAIAEMREKGLEGTALDELIKDDMFMKFLLNNGYGKFAQNPRRYKEHCITEVGDAPDGDDDWGDLPASMTEDYWIWERATPAERFNNVATGASITGAARSVLLDAICSSEDAIYCDTDSLICRELRGVKIDKTELGAWDIECELDEVIVCGKKLYGYTRIDGVKKTRAKGASALTYDDIVELYNGATILSVGKGVTLTKTGGQYYMERRISATAPLMN